MPTTKVKANYQVTIPLPVRETLDIKEGQIFEARAENGRVVLILQEDTSPAGEMDIDPVETIPQKDLDLVQDIASYLGSMKGVYGATAEEVQAYLHKEREAWH